MNGELSQLLNEGGHVIQELLSWKDWVDMCRCPSFHTVGQGISLAVGVLQLHLLLLLLIQSLDLAYTFLPCNYGLLHYLNLGTATIQLLELFVDDLVHHIELELLYCFDKS